MPKQQRENWILPSKSVALYFCNTDKISGIVYNASIRIKHIFPQERNTCTHRECEGERQLSKSRGARCCLEALSDAACAGSVRVRVQIPPNAPTKYTATYCATRGRHHLQRPGSQSQARLPADCLLQDQDPSPTSSPSSLTSSPSIFGTAPDFTAWGHPHTDAHIAYAPHHCRHGSCHGQRRPRTLSAYRPDVLGPGTHQRSRTRPASLVSRPSIQTERCDSRKDRRQWPPYPPGRSYTRVQP